MLPYVNPPFIAVLFSPLALLPIGTAFYLWTIGELGLLIWLMILINRTFSDWTKQERLIMTITILAFWPLVHTFLLGQFSILFLICILQVYIAIRNSKLSKTGLWLSLLIIKPQILPLPGMMTLNKRYWRITVSAVISGAAIIIFSSVFLGFGIWLQYLKILPAMSNNFGRFGFISKIQYTLKGVLTNILGYTQSSNINIISICLLIGGMIFVWLLWMPEVAADSQKFKLNFAFTILITAFLSLHAYPHDDLILVLPATLFYDYLRQNNYPRKAYSIIILTSPFIFFVPEFTAFNLFGVFRPPVIIILILVTWMIYYLMIERQVVKYT